MMSPRSVSDMTVPELVEMFVVITLAQDAAELRGQIAKYSRLFGQMKAVTNELKGRAGDQRTELLKLFAHPNLHVRVQAAKETLAVDPVAARDQLETIAGSDRFPYAGDAGMSLWNLDRGVFRPT